MGHPKVLSSKYNMSLGFIPVIISILLSEVISQDLSTYIGAGVGILLCLGTWRHRGLHIPQLLLYSITGMLLLLSFVSLLSTSYLPQALFPFTLEISAVIPPLIIYLNRRRFVAKHNAQTGQCCQQVHNQGLESTIVSARVVIIISVIHFLIILVAVLFARPLSSTTHYILFNVLPPAVFIVSILFNEFGIRYFNQVMKHTLFLPIVNKKGDVVGKAIASEAIQQKNDYIIPMIRIAVASHGRLFLLPRPECCTLDRDKTDSLLESYLLYGETLEEGAIRTLRQILPTAPLNELFFNFMYHYEDEATNRLIYLFTLDLSDDSILCNEAFKGGKLWTFQQIEHNLDRNFFSHCFEYEYEQLKSIICTREKYKEF